MYSGYGHFEMGELVGAPPAKHRSRERPGRRSRPQRGPARSDGSAEAPSAANSLGLFGLTLVTCARGDLRETADGLALYQSGSATPISVPDELRGAAELEELFQAVRFGAPAVHDGRWGAATLEVCLAIHESARTSREIILERQTGHSA